MLLLSGLCGPYFQMEQSQPFCWTQRLPLDQGYLHHDGQLLFFFFVENSFSENHVANKEVGFLLRKKMTVFFRVNERYWVLKAVWLDGWCQVTSVREGRTDLAVWTRQIQHRKRSSLPGVATWNDSNGISLSRSLSPALFLMWGRAWRPQSAEYFEASRPQSFICFLLLVHYYWWWRDTCLYLYVTFDIESALCSVFFLIYYHLVFISGEYKVEPALRQTDHRKKVFVLQTCVA